MHEKTQQLDRLHDALQERGYKPETTFEQATPKPDRGGRVERWSGPGGERMVEVGLEYGVVVSVEVYAPLVESSSLEKTLEALGQQI